MQRFIKNIKFFRVVIVVVLWFTLCAVPACRGTKGTRTAYKSQKEAVKQNNKDHDEMLKSHYERQSDVTKQMMKDMKRENKKIKRSKKRSLWDRLFRKNCP